LFCWAALGLKFDLLGDSDFTYFFEGPNQDFQSKFGSFIFVIEDYLDSNVSRFVCFPLIGKKLNFYLNYSGLGECIEFNVSVGVFIVVDINDLLSVHLILLNASGDLKKEKCLTFPFGVIGFEFKVWFESFKFWDSHIFLSTMFPSGVITVGSLFINGNISWREKSSS